MEEKHLKRIELIKSTNYCLSDTINTLPTDDNLDSEKYKQLREYVLTEVDLTKYKDPEIIFKTMEWVSLQWKHDGMNEGTELTSYEILQSVKKGKRYRCVEYGKVTSDILQSLGYISRQVSLRHKDVDYGGFSMGHVATEVWSNEDKKWIFVDPQLCIYAKYNDKYLNFYDMYELKKDNKFNDIEFIVPEGYQKNNNIKDLNEYIQFYKNFLINYFGYIAVGYLRDNKKSSLALLLDGEKPFFTFQGLNNGNTIFTTKSSDLYYSLNETVVIFDYKQQSNFKEAVDKFKIDTNEDYHKYMPYFQAIPDFKLTFQNNMKWFSHYELSIDDSEWTKLYGNTYEWKLNDGINKLQVRAINKAGVKGCMNTIEIKYE